MHSPLVIQHVSDRAGFDNFKTGITNGTTRTQQAFVTMFVCLLSSPNHCKRILSDTGLLSKLVQLLDHHSLVLKGKIYLLLAEMCARSHAVLLACCEQRMVMYMERDSKRVKQHVIGGGGGFKDNSVEGLDYLHSCLVVIVSNILKTVPQIQQGSSLSFIYNNLKI